MPDGGMICSYCDPVRPPRPDQQTAPFPHHELAQTVRRMKGLVMASIVLGIIAAPVAIWVATKALHRHAVSSSADPADVRQLILMKRIAIGLLVFWAFVLGQQVAWLFQGG
jgi:uncharacterized membrane protein